LKRSKISAWFVFISILISPVFLNGQIKQIENPTTNSSVHPEIQSGFSYLNNFAFEDAQLMTTKSKTLYPLSAWPHLLQANINWWRIVSGENLPIIRQQMLLELESAKKKADNSHEGLFCLIMANTYRTRLELLNGNNMAAVVHLKSYYQNLRKSLGHEQEYDAFYITSGLYYYLAWIAWNDYPMLRPFLFFLDKGSKSMGIKFLTQATLSNDQVISTEAVYFLMRIYFDMEKDREVALKYATILVKKHPGNFIFSHYYLQCIEKEKVNEERKIRKESVLKNAQLSNTQKLYFYLLLQK
jgi:hypothetical protein